VDAHVVGPAEYEEIPELTDEMMDRADEYLAGKLVRKGGRPKSDSPKVAVNIRLSPDVVAAFKATGKGWQTRIDEALRKAVGLL
jgi:uncharacterized protein (DUF4415 family)